MYDPEAGETNPRATDSDNDGLGDAIEIDSELDLDPNSNDSDEDGLPDGLKTPTRTASMNLTWVRPTQHMQTQMTMGFAMAVKTSTPVER